MVILMRPDHILDVIIVVKGIPTRIKPSSIWFGADDFKQKQQWMLKATDLDTDKIIDVPLADISGFLPVLKAEEGGGPTLSRSETKRIEATTDDRHAEGKQMLLDYVEDYEVGSLAPPKKPGDGYPYE